VQSYFSGKGPNRADTPPKLPAVMPEQENDPSLYVADDGLIAAVNVSLMIGQPLLLTGKPGTGKTSLANRIAWERNFDLSQQLHKFYTKSTSVARDLHYSIDNVGRFHKERGASLQAYLSLNALGKAIVQSHPPEALPEEIRELTDHTEPRQSVVLIDEIDKAPRDFPNDLLNEIDRGEFSIPELVGEVKVHSNPEFRPIVVITSNSERNLPEPFLRRCVYYHIPPPTEDALERILKNRLQSEALPIFLKSCIKFFLSLANHNLRKEPSTSELIKWVNALVLNGAKTDQPVSQSIDAVKKSYSALLKYEEDLARADEFTTKLQDSKNNVASSIAGVEA